MGGQGVKWRVGGSYVSKWCVAVAAAALLLFAVASFLVLTFSRIISVFLSFEA